MDHLAINLGGKESQICVRNRGGQIMEERRGRTAALPAYLAMRPRSRVIVETCSEAFGIADAALGRARGAGRASTLAPSALAKRGPLLLSSDDPDSDRDLRSGSPVREARRAVRGFRSGLSEKRKMAVDAVRDRGLCGFASRCGRVLCVHRGVSVHAGAGVGSALGIAQGGTVDADRVALMAQPTEERVDEGFIAEKRLPFGVVQVGRDNRGFSAVAFLHQFEKDVRLFGFQIQIPQFVDKCGAPHLLTNHDRSEMWSWSHSRPVLSAMTQRR